VSSEALLKHHIADIKETADYTPPPELVSPAWAIPPPAASDIANSAAVTSVRMRQGSDVNQVVARINFDFMIRAP